MMVNDKILWFKALFGKVFSDIEMDDMISKLVDLGFFEKPGSISHHDNGPNGLFLHSCNVTQNLVRFTERLNLRWQLPRSPYVVGMFHDLCKCDNYIWDEENKCWTYNDAVKPGHGDKSVEMAKNILDLTEEEMLCIRWHMGAFDSQENWSKYSDAVRRYPNVLYAHTADMEAACFPTGVEETESEKKIVSNGKPVTIHFYRNVCGPNFQHSDFRPFKTWADYVEQVCNKCIDLYGLNTFRNKMLDATTRLKFNSGIIPFFTKTEAEMDGRSCRRLADDLWVRTNMSEKNTLSFVDKLLMMFPEAAHEIIRT